MKYLCVLLALGALICATYAAPASSEIQQDDGPLNEDALLKQMLTDVARSQQDNDGNNSPAEVQFWGSLFRLVSKPLFRALGGAVGKRLSRRRRRKHRRRYEAAELQEDSLIQALLENQLESVAKEQQDEDGDNGDLIATIERLSEVAAQDDGDSDSDGGTVAKAELFKKLGKLFRKGRNLDLMAAIESLPEKARAQFLFSVGIPVLTGLLGSMLNKG